MSAVIYIGGDQTSAKFIKLKNIIMRGNIDAVVVVEGRIMIQAKTSLRVKVKTETTKNSILFQSQLTKIIQS